MDFSTVGLDCAAHGPGSIRRSLAMHVVPRPAPAARGPPPVRRRRNVSEPGRPKHWHSKFLRDSARDSDMAAIRSLEVAVRLSESSPGIRSILATPCN